MLTMFWEGCLLVDFEFSKASEQHMCTGAQLCRAHIVMLAYVMQDRKLTMLIHARCVQTQAQTQCLSRNMSTAGQTVLCPPTK